MPIKKKMQSLLAGTLDHETAKALIEKHATGKFAESSTRRAALRWLDSIVNDENVTDRDVLYHKGNLTLDALMTAKKKPWPSLLIVDGNLIINGLFKDSLNPESVVIVTGDLHATDMINEGFLEVHGDVVVKRSVLFLDNDACTEIFGNLTAPFVYTKYHAVKVHHVVKAALVTGDSPHIRAKEMSFIKETDHRVKDMLSLKLLKRLSEEIFEEEDADDDSGWIDFIDSEKLSAFVEKGNDPLEKGVPPRAKKR